MAPPRRASTSTAQQVPSLIESYFEINRTQNYPEFLGRPILPRPIECWIARLPRGHFRAQAKSPCLSLVVNHDFIFKAAALRGLRAYGFGPGCLASLRGHALHNGGCGLSLSRVPLAPCSSQCYPLIFRVYTRNLLVLCSSQPAGTQRYLQLPH